jgi:hypothetical protein
MKKILLFSAVLLATAASSHAGGIDIRIGLPLPPLPHIVIGHPAPRVVVAPPRVVVSRPCPPPLVVAPAYPRVVAPSVVYGAPPARVVYVPRHRYCGHFKHYGECRHYYRRY